MQNFFKNATKVYNVAQEIRREISASQNQQQRARRSASRSRSRSPSSSEPKFETIDTRGFVQFDKETCFSVMHNPHDDYYHTIHIESGMCALKTTDYKQAEAQRNLLNKFRVVAKSAYQCGVLSQFIGNANKHPNFSDIHLACSLGLSKLVERLCEGDALVAINRATPDECLLPLHIAILYKHLTLTKQLLDYGADLRKCDNGAKNCLHYAAKNDLAFIKELYNAKPEQFRECLNRADGKGFSPFQYSIRSEATEVAKFFMESGADTSLIGVDLRELNVSLNGLNAVLHHNPNALVGDPIQPYMTFLHREFERDFLKVAHRWNPKIVDHPNPDGRTPLHSAILRGDLDGAVDLLSYGAKVDLVGKMGNTPLNLAVQKGHEDMVKLLLCFDSDYNLKNKQGVSPIEANSTVAISRIFKQFVDNKQMSAISEAGHDLPSLIQAKQNRTVDYQENLDADVRKQSLRLLSLDGGGIRGLCLIILLRRIERHIRKGKIADYVDWIGGTSTGGILALVLAHGYTTQQCLQLYLRLKDEVFVGTRTHCAKPLERYLKELFGEQTNMADIKKKVMITTTKSNTNPPQLVLMRSYEMNPLNTLSLPPATTKAWFAARCSSAAPTYFPSVNNTYIDGGLIANNPTPDLLADVHHFNMQRENDEEEPIPISCLISLGTGKLPDRPMEKLDVELPKGFSLGALFTDLTGAIESLNNLKNIFVEQLATSDGQIVERSRAWCHAMNIPFYRYTPQLEVECPLNTRNNQEIVTLMWTAKLYAESRSDAEIEQIVSLLRANEN